MITKAQVKEIHALTTRMGRVNQGAFLVEGDKLVREWLKDAAGIKYIAGVGEWLSKNESLIRRHPSAIVLEISEAELGKISSQQTPHAVVAVAAIPKPPAILPHKEWCIVLDTVQDPGNVGAIIRIADWYGIGHIVCSPGCADFYNPKVVGAAMGGHLRVQLHTSPLHDFLSTCGMPILAATLSGLSLNQASKPIAAALIIGNESKGISQEVMQLATQHITIEKRGGAESLNAAVAAGIILNHFLSPS